MKRISTPRFGYALGTVMVLALIMLAAVGALLAYATNEYRSARRNELATAAFHLAERGIGSREAMERFRLGYANRTLGLRLPAKNRKLGADLRGRLTKIGIYRETGHEHFSGSLVVPIFGDQGEVVQLYGRKTTPRLRPGTPLHLWLPGPRHGVWNRDGIHGATADSARTDSPTGVWHSDLPHPTPASRMTFWIATSSAPTSCSTFASEKM